MTSPAIDFLMAKVYRQIVVAGPNSIDGDQWRATIMMDGNSYTGYAENGHEALIQAIRRYRATNPNSDVFRGSHWAGTDKDGLDIISSNPFIGGSGA